jgi:membrane protein YqaA with SNARE-associated domain
MSTTAERPNIVRRMYDWVLSWADSPYGLLALGILSFAEASFFPIPPDVLLIALVLGARDKWIKLALVCSLASVAGALAGYYIGAGLWSAVDSFFYEYVPGFTPEKFTYVEGLYKEYDFWLVFAAGFTPIPFKVITITAGAFSLNLPMFILASTLSRSARFFLVAFLLHRYGEPIRAFIDKWFNVLAIVFTVLLIGGFLLIKVAMQ